MNKHPNPIKMGDIMNAEALDWASIDEGTIWILISTSPSLVVVVV